MTRFEKFNEMLFESYCKKSVSNAIKKEREKKAARGQLELSFSVLTDAVLYALSTQNERTSQPEKPCQVFSVQGMNIPVYHEKLGQALSHLMPKDREIILLYFFKGLKDAKVEELVLQNLQRVVAYAREDEDEFVRRVIDNKLAVQRTEQEQSKRKLEKQKRRITELDAIIQRLYEDNVTGKLTDERFAKLSATYEAEQAELKQSVESLSAIVEASEAQAVNIKSFLKIVKKYTEPTELTPQLLHEFVDKIVVHEADKSSGHRIQRIDVHYNFIGEIDFSPEYCG